MTPIYTNLVSPTEIPDWEKEAAAQGKVLDHWPFYPVLNSLTAVRFVADQAAREVAQSCRYLGLEPPRR